MNSRLPKGCPVLSLNKPECKRYLEALSKIFGGGGEADWCKGEISKITGNEPRYLRCPLFSRWFWENEKADIREALKEINKGGKHVEQV